MFGRCFLGVGFLSLKKNFLEERTKKNPPPSLRPKAQNLNLTPWPIITHTHNGLAVTHNHATMRIRWGIDSPNDGRS